MTARAREEGVNRPRQVLQLFSSIKHSFQIYGRVEEAPSMRAASCDPAVDVDSLIPVSDFARALEEDDDCSNDSDSDDDLASNYASSGGETPKYEFSDLGNQDSLDDTPAM